MKMVIQSDKASMAILYMSNCYRILDPFPDSKVHGANMGPTGVLSALDGPHVGPMNLAIRVHMYITP